IFFLLSLFLGQPGLFAAFGVEQPSVHAGLVFFALLYTPLELVLSLATQAFSRKHEFEADAYARATTGDAEELVSALQRLSPAPPTHPPPPPLAAAPHPPPPPLVERVRALRA